MPTAIDTGKTKPPLRARMRRWLYESQRLITRYVWWPLTHITYVVHPAPILSALIIFALLAFVGQIHEIYLVYLEPPYDSARGWQIAMAAWALALLSAALYYANYSLSDVTIDIVWSESRDIDRDSRLRLIRNTAGLVCAALPWAGVWFGVSNAGLVATRNIEQINEARGMLGWEIETASLTEALKGLQWSLLIVALCGIVVVRFLHVFRRSAWLRWSVFGAIALLFLASAFAPSLMGRPRDMEAVVWMFRAVGPLGMIILDVLLLFACVAVLIVLSREVGLPVVMLVVVIAMVAILLPLEAGWTALPVTLSFLTVAVLALLSRRWELLWFSFALVLLSVGFAWRQHPPKMELAGHQSSPDLAASYKDWLKERESLRGEYQKARGGRYPVFIIAAEGGGIYAASAAAAFLSRLQERCPSFAQHVFAISGVSGGAVGAAVFHSAIRDERLKETGCEGGSDPLPGGVAKTSAAVLQADHLSPLLGFIIPDLLGRYDRAHGLEQSLMHSIKDNAGRASEGLKERFDSHWHPARAAPVLVLNATWVENGHRVAFAPFRLDGSPDKTLHSFRDVDRDDGLLFKDPKLREMSLAGAAVVSARFPAILPAFMIHDDDNPWSFVDGGYKDSSGALTALALFEAIKAESPPDVKPRLILLTSTQPEFDRKAIRGRSAPDLLAPAIAMLSVRDRLAEDAVARTMSSHPDAEGDWHVRPVATDQQSFVLSLGWTISRSTHAILSLQMGEPDLCSKKDEVMKRVDSAKKKAAVEKRNIYIPAKTLVENSCVMHSIVNLIDLRAAAAK